MPLPMLSVLRQLRQDLAHQLAPRTILAVCRDLQDETGRLWDVLNMLRFAIAGMKKDVTPWFALPRQTAPGKQVDFAVHVRNDDREGDPPLVRLYALCGPGDNAEPVITVMLPHED